MFSRMKCATIVFAAIAFGLSGNGQAKAGTISYTFDGTEAIMSDRLIRDGNASDYTSQKSYPGVVNESNRYVTFDLGQVATSSAFFVHVDLTPSSTFNIFASLYAGSFNPNNLATNYLGDAGQSGSPQDFSITANTGINLILVLNSVFGIDAANGLKADVTYSPTLNDSAVSAVPEPASMITLAAGAIGMLGFRMRKRKVTADVAA